MPNYEITVSIHVPDELAALLEPQSLAVRPRPPLMPVAEDAPKPAPALVAEKPPTDKPAAKPPGEPTIDDVRAAATDAVQRLPTGAGPELLKRLGVSKLSELGEDQYAAAIKLFTEAT